MMIYGHPICANCNFFTWSTINDYSGECGHLNAQVDGNQSACEHFQFNPPCLRKAQEQEKESTT